MRLIVVVLGLCLVHVNGQCEVPNLTEHILPNDQPIVTLDAKVAFEGLTKKERLYAHYMSKAGFYGSLIVELQTSPEAPQIFRLIHRVHTTQNITSLRKAAFDNGVSDKDFQAFLVYCNGFYSNMGNYKSIGDSKFIPNLPSHVFERILRSSDAWDESLQTVWNSCRDDMYSLWANVKNLGLGEEGVTKYFSDNCNHSDGEKIKRYLQFAGIDGWNTRAFKTIDRNGSTLFEIRHAAMGHTVLRNDTFEGDKFVVTTGDYDTILQLVVENLENAKKYAANEVEEKMLENYILSFKVGSEEAHKNGSRFWIKNKGPSVETYIGFIEVYRDPFGIRAEFEGFVSMVNKERSVAFQELVKQAEKFIPRLPWSKGFEKDSFLRPDFTSLDVLTFAGALIPAGINIPNYDDVRQKDGFKNVNLGNVVAAMYKVSSKGNRTSFLTKEDFELIKKYKLKAFEVQVGLHELLGHGSGKLFYRQANGSFNFNRSLVNPLTSKAVEEWYEEGETYGSKFGSIGSSYEECRAECVGLYLSTEEEVLSIFGHVDKDVQNDVTYVNWLSLVLRGITSLEEYNPDNKKWNQAHSRARFVILNVLIEAGEDFVSIEEIVGSDGKPDLLVKMDRAKLLTVGRPAIGKFLQKLQIFKACGDNVKAQAMYNNYSAVSSDGKFPWLKWRDIVIARKEPRKIMVQANTRINNATGDVDLIGYEESHEGHLQSWVERFPKEEVESIDRMINALYLEDRPYFP